MRYSTPVKFIAILLCALGIVCSCVSILGIVQVARLGLYTEGFDNWVHNRLQWEAKDLAENLTDRYAVRALTNCPDEVLEELGYWYVFQDSVHWTGVEQDRYGFAITDPQGIFLAGHSLAEGVTGNVYQIACKVQYPVQVTDQKQIDEEYGTEYVRREIVQLSAYDNKPVTIRYYESPLYQVTVQLDNSAVMGRSGTSLELLEIACAQRYAMIAVLAAALTVVAVCMVYLCFAAGRSTVEGVLNPAGLNRLPLDLYLAACAGGTYGLVLLAIDLINHWIFGVDELNVGTLTIVGLVLFCIALIVVGFLMAVAAQVKGHDGRWWTNTVICWCCQKTAKGMAVVCTQLVKLLPLMWKYILIGLGMIIPVLLFGYLAFTGAGFWLIPLTAALLADVGILMYGAYAYGCLLRGAERMAKGDLHTKIDKTYLVGLYAKCADDLNALADTAVLAAKNQMRSERMKTELITNVSHDIKTPLTSIINYVDLLQSAQTLQEQTQYLEVLGRQSQRLKKLIEDLVEMSKATSGNMSVDIVEMDPVETVNQALGEFSDKLAAAELTILFRQPDGCLSMYGDGRLTWRVLSNLLSNVVKYALPGTRVYLDVQQLEGRVLISVKNISKEPLNISAEELTERFVRGDASRNTEGSGLGLNIAKSLMELQKGQLQLLVDGDLFKVTLIFPTTR